MPGIIQLDVSSKVKPARNLPNIQLSRDGQGEITDAFAG
jgi:hypothetical protein